MVFGAGLEDSSHGDHQNTDDNCFIAYDKFVNFIIKLGQLPYTFRLGYLRSFHNSILEYIESTDPSKEVRTTLVIYTTHLDKLQNITEWEKVYEELNNFNHNNRDICKMFNQILP